MAPLQVRTSKQSEQPLADYFFIIGIESSQVVDEKFFPTALVSPTSPGTVDATIEENVALEEEGQARPTSADFVDIYASKRRSARLSYETRKSISSMLTSSDSKTASNRSSATIKAIVPNQVRQTMTDADFDTALQKFTAERENFLDEIQFSAGALPQLPRKRKSKIYRILNANEDENMLKNGVGSLKRRLSTMNSLKRQPTVMRQTSVRTSRRLSGYNSVIPNPQPLQYDPNMHPLKRKYEPVLLDRYPPKDLADGALKNRASFPDYVPMFAFPNDVCVVSSDRRPLSTWHGFAMTSADGSKLYGITVIVWLPLNEIASPELERQCEVWRRKNMTNEERELAASLAERLALERAKLSHLLAQLPSLPQGSEERENLQEQIDMVEEKISVMNGMLMPVRHGAASKIEGLTDGGSGFWIPRAFGILGRDGSLTSFWKEWLKAVIVPMMNGSVMHVPASSPRIGMWQPLERYVVNLCAEAPSPDKSLTQIELSIRELRLYARKNADNELPGSRNTDLYALFRCLSIPNIITLFEYVLAESRIILLSSYTSMLHLASQALISLIYPLNWSAVFIPVLPVRLIQALEAPCPYIVGIERRYENFDFPDDDFVLVDLDENIIESTAAPIQLPRHQRRKLQSLLQIAAQHHTRYGVPIGPPDYAQATYPNHVYSTENSSVYTNKPAYSTLSSLVSQSSTSFGSSSSRPPVIINAFAQSQVNSIAQGSESPYRPAGNSRLASPPSPKVSPISGYFTLPLSAKSTSFTPLPGTPTSRQDSALAFQATLREKRSGHLDSGSSSQRSASFGFDRGEQFRPPGRRPSQPFLHSHTPSSSTLNSEFRAGSTYATSVYAQSTLAASTIMPGFVLPPAVSRGSTSQCIEGHVLQEYSANTMAAIPGEDDRSFDSVCNMCDEPGHAAGDPVLKCAGCGIVVHPRCAMDISVVCPEAFRADQVRATFVRCLASLFSTYRKYFCFASSEQKKNGLLYAFNADGFVKSLPGETSEFMAMMRNTQAFNEFIHERELASTCDSPSIQLFDAIISSKKHRSSARSTFRFISGTSGSGIIHPNSKVSSHARSKKTLTTAFLIDNSNHVWRNLAATAPASRFPGDYRSIISRCPAKLESSLMKEPRIILGAPRKTRSGEGSIDIGRGEDGKMKRKPIISARNGL